MGKAFQRAPSQRLGQGINGALSRVGENSPHNQVPQQKENATSVDWQHLPAERSQAKEYGRKEYEIRQDQGQIRLHVSHESFRTYLGRIHKRRVQPDPYPHADAGENDQLGDQ